MLTIQVREFLLPLEHSPEQQSEFFEHFPELMQLLVTGEGVANTGEGVVGAGVDDTGAGVDATGDETGAGVDKTGEGVVPSLMQVRLFLFPPEHWPEQQSVCLTHVVMLQ